MHLWANLDLRAEAVTRTRVLTLTGLPPMLLYCKNGLKPTLANTGQIAKLKACATLLASGPLGSDKASHAGGSGACGFSGPWDPHL